MSGGEVNKRMQADWDRRAREDANYYVAFGRRDQDDEEFFATASEMVKGFKNELKRLPAGVSPRARRALEIGCGPGRLMRPLSPNFGEIHGTDISEEMIRLARQNLRDIPHAHAHHAATSDLAAFADESFDFVYSYAVFQHIPSREVVLDYLRETRRVLKLGGVARLQLNGLPETAAKYDTWNGVRISAAEVADFARGNDFQLLALEGVSTQYMWTTWRKRPERWVAALPDQRPAQAVSLRRITNAFSSEPVAPTRGRFSSISLWIDKLPQECDLNHLKVLVGGKEAFVSYIGPPESDGLQQVNGYLPDGLATGLQRVRVLWFGKELCPPSTLRVVPPGPPVPRIVTVSDGINLLSGTKIVTRSVKVVIEEAACPEEFEATLGEEPVGDFDIFCTDPRLPGYEINFKVPERVGAGKHRLKMRLGRRQFAPVNIEVVAGD